MSPGPTNPFEMAPVHETGEHIIGEKTGLSLKLVIALVGMVLGIAGIGALARAAGEDAGAALAENKVQDKAISALQQEAAVDRAVNKADHDSMKAILLEIKQDVKDLKKK
jgi:hypothetical protein